jgi:hypothetical protein
MGGAEAVEGGAAADPGRDAIAMPVPPGAPPMRGCMSARLASSAMVAERLGG